VGSDGDDDLGLWATTGLDFAAIWRQKNAPSADARKPAVFDLGSRGLKVESILRAKI
jgi:hypothetical protein